MIIFLYISFFILFLYLLQIGIFVYGFIKLKTYNIKVDNFEIEKRKHLSVLIPFKNEEENLEKLIQNLKNQTLPPEYFEVILINDNSIDSSEHIVIEIIKGIPNFKLINTKLKNGGKKSAMQEGIKVSNANIIVTSDADCIHQKKWLETILSYYFEHKPKMLIAPVLMIGNSFFQKLQAIDFLGLTASTAGSCGIKHPIMCSGANLVYEKNIFYEFNDALNNKEASGDDMFLLHNIKKKYAEDIHYLKSNNAIVYTEAEKYFTAFFRQRIRWAGKSKSYKDVDTIVSAILVFGVNFLFITLLFLTFIDNSFFIYLFVFWGMKFIVDVFFLIITGKYFKQFPNIILLFLLSLAYPFYIEITAIVSFFVKTIGWKN